MKTGLIDSSAARKHFPILESGLVYLDNAASSLTPEPVLDAMNAYYRGFRSNVHRGLYPESEQATSAFESARATVASFIGGQTHEVIFTSGATASLNMAARLFAQELQEGDEILVTAYEHHSSLLPWQLLAAEKKLVIRMVRPNPDTHEISSDDVADCITPRTKILAINHVSNVTGYELPVAEIAAHARKAGVIVIVDASQSISHIPVNVAELQCDALAFSGHKVFGPTGIGALWVRAEHLQRLEPVFGGGGTVDTVDVTTHTWNDIPHRFEPGTPPIAEAIGLGVAIEWLTTLAAGASTATTSVAAAIPMRAVHQTNAELYSYAAAALDRIPEITLIGLTDDLTKHHGSISFTTGTIHPHDIASILGEQKIAVRAGHHCCQPLMRHFGIPSTTRFSVHITNTPSDIDTAVQALQNAIQTLRA